MFEWYWSSAGFFVKIYGYVCKTDLAQFVFWTAVGFQPHSLTRSSSIRRTKNVNWCAFNGAGVVEFNARIKSSVVGFTGITLLMAIISSYLLVDWWHACACVTAALLTFLTCSVNCRISSLSRVLNIPIFTSVFSDIALIQDRPKWCSGYDDRLLTQRFWVRIPGKVWFFR
jgi:hypothetical protein